ncbi:MAG: hypothetical protein ACR2L2_12425 [Acidobacteriota bacterium]
MPKPSIPVRTYRLSGRVSKVDVGQFGAPVSAGSSLRTFLDSLPRILAGDDIRKVADAMMRARRQKRSVLWGLGGHVIKVGLAPILIDLIKEGFVQGLALNGAGIIHDFEIALQGKTSEDVERELERGRFGLAEETGRLLNEAISQGASDNLGMGESVGRLLARLKPRYGRQSLVLQAYRAGVPVTVHVAVGADVIHNHPSADGAAIGKTTFADYKTFVAGVEKINDGGVYLNVGSSVILPEVFLKAVARIRGQGRRLEKFTTVNLDFIQHYRPTQNVVRRPTSRSGQGFAITGHHELTIPLLAALLKCRDKWPVSSGRVTRKAPRNSPLATRG